MNQTIPPDAQRLVDRLRMLAYEVESAARYGVPIPYMFSVSGNTHGRVTFDATPEQFDAWADYTEAGTTEYEHEGSQWASAEAHVNGLPLAFAVKYPEASS